jgi:hypothetical protein
LLSRDRKDAFQKGRLNNFFVIPAQAGIYLFQWVMDSRLRGSDGFRVFYDSIKKTEPYENARDPLYPARLFPSAASMLSAEQRGSKKT